MTIVNFDSIASQMPAAWKSTVVAQIGNARVKVLRMDEMAYEEESHDYNEGLFVVSGQMKLEVLGKMICVEAGQMYLAEAGTPHAVLAGSHGTLVIIDV
ncbi:MAG: cupin domain-containing protein [Pseudomonadota bacterium]